jgi:peptide deformylase
MRAGLASVGETVYASIPSSSEGEAMVEILKYPDTLLRRQARPVAEFDGKLREIVRDMVDSMTEAHGVGLAGPQVGLARRLIIVDTRPATQLEGADGVPPMRHPLEARMPLALINPEITDAGGTQLGQEGCLSLPEVWADVERTQWIHVRAQDPTGKPLEFECSDFFARVIQHEIDHLEGVLFIDRLTQDRFREVKPPLRKLEREFRKAERAKRRAKVTA